MIPNNVISEWRAEAPWESDYQVEQDLVISCAMVEMFKNTFLREGLAMRGGTALNKLYLRPASRYSEDIDFVQIRAERAGPMMGAIRDALQPWLGKPKWKQSAGRLTFYFHFQSETVPSLRMRLKIEINTREYFSVYGFIRKPFSVSTSWYEGSSEITTFTIDDLIAKKFHALYQRRQGRDLFDIAVVLNENMIDPERVISDFSRYMEFEGKNITRAQFEQNLYLKLQEESFLGDIELLRATGYSWRAEEAARNVHSRLIALLPGEPWQGDDETEGFWAG